MKRKKLKRPPPIRQKPAPKPPRNPQPLLSHYLDEWQLTPDGEPVPTPSSLVAPVRVGEHKAMLKIYRKGVDGSMATHALRLWRGRGAVALLRFSDRAHLLEKLEAPNALVEMALRGDDDRATRIIANVAAELHHDEPERLLKLRPHLREFFTYEPSARAGIVYKARALYFDTCRQGGLDMVSLHGDLHHGNVMLGRDGFVAIDPKGIRGDRTYDLANVLLNPYPHRELVMQPMRMLRQATILAEMLDLELERLLRWTVIHGCAAAAWAQGDAKAEAWWLDGATVASGLLDAHFPAFGRDWLRTHPLLDEAWVCRARERPGYLRVPGLDEESSDSDDEIPF